MPCMPSSSFLLALDEQSNSNAWQQELKGALEGIGLLALLLCSEGRFALVQVSSA